MYGYTLSVKKGTGHHHELCHNRKTTIGRLCVEVRVSPCPTEPRNTQNHLINQLPSPRETVFTCSPPPLKLDCDGVFPNEEPRLQSLRLVHVQNRRVTQRRGRTSNRTSARFSKLEKTHRYLVELVMAPISGSRCGLKNLSREGRTEARRCGRSHRTAQVVMDQISRIGCLNPSKSYDDDTRIKCFNSVPSR